MRKLAVIVSGTLLVGMLLVLLGQPVRAEGVPFLSLVNMGMPTSPQPWHPSDFAVSKHVRDGHDGSPAPDDGGTPMTADHGTDCSAPPATHPTNGSYDSMVFVCHDHMMTAFNSDNSGYGVISIQPNQLVDFSTGPATVDISVSTWRMSGRDWIDFDFSPFNQQVSYPVANGEGADGRGKAKDDVQVQMCSTEFILCGFESSNFQDQQLFGNGNWWTSLNELPGYSVSKTARLPIEFVISTTHLKVWVPSLNHVFVDADFPTPLTFNQAVFQFEHHSYTPSKAGCEYPPQEQVNLGLCNAPNTWHWSNLSISSAVHYTLINASTDAVGNVSGDTVQFPAPAPEGSHLRFEAYPEDGGGMTSVSDYRISVDGGLTWQPLQLQETNPLDMVQWGPAFNIWQPIPAGTTSVKLKTAGSWWYARNFTIMSLSTSPASSTATPPPPAPTPTLPAPTPTLPAPTPTAIPMPIDINNTPCMVTINGVMTNGTCTGTFLPTP